MKIEKIVKMANQMKAILVARATVQQSGAVAQSLLQKGQNDNEDPFEMGPNKK